MNEEFEINTGFENPGKSKDMMAINFSRYNTPVFQETQFKDWINYGSDNLYPNYLIEMLNKSATHSAIVEAKVKQIIGEGINFLDSEDKDQLAEIMAFVKRTNKYETFNDIIRKITFDFVVFGGFALNLIWSRDRTCISEIHHVDFSTLRVGKPNEETGEIDCYYFSENWKNYTKPKFKPRALARFSTGNRIDASQILYIKPYRANTLFYPLPSYIGAMNYVELEYELSNYQLNSLKNGLSPSIMINFNNGQPTIAEREDIYRSIKSNFTGTDSAGKFMLFFNKSKETSAEVTPIPINDLDKVYTVMNESVVQNIMTAHRVTSPALLGIPSPGAFGSSQELILASELFFNQVIAPDQVVIEEVLNKILEVNGWTLKANLKDIQPISFQIQDENVMLKVMTTDEIRAKMGLPVLNDAQKIEIANTNGTPIPTPSTAGPTISATPVTTNQSIEQPIVNEAVKSLTAKQHQQLVRIIRQVSKGTITREVGSILLKTGLGLSQEDIDVMLPEIEDEDLSIQVAPSVPKYVHEVDPKKKLNNK